MKNKKIVITICLMLIFILNLSIIEVYATDATISLTATNTTPTVGESVTITATAVAGAFNLTLSGNGETKQIVGQTDITDNVSKSASITFTPTEAKTYTFTLSGDYTDFYKDDATMINGKTITITAKNKEEQKTAEEKPEEKPKEEQTPIQEKPAKETETKQTPVAQEPEKKTETPAPVVEPNFTSADKTMYSTGIINLRSSWSTSSEKITIAKGTELKVVATSTNKVNGYVWYKVSYNGQTKYVASNLLTSTKPQEEEKSNNANLKTLTIQGQTLIPEFSKTVTSYTVQVENDVTKIDVKAEPEDAKAKVSIKGNEELKDENNIVSVSVSAEDGTIKIYEINVEKLKKQEDIKLALKTLKVEGTDISSKLKPDTYKYEVQLKEDKEKIDIKVTATDENANIEILGNENLDFGENIITIIVSPKDGEEKVTYQIIVNKLKNVEPSVQTNTQQEDSLINKIMQNPKILLYGGVAIVVLIALIIVVIYVVKHRKQDDYDYSSEEDLEELPGALPEKKIEDYEDNKLDENVPRRKGKHF